MVGILIALFVFSWGLTAYLRRYALAKNLMDIPNHRSSHQVPTPRGGGVAFVIGFLVVVPVMINFGFVTLWSGLALFFGGLFIAMLGFLDDHGHIEPYWRLLGHVAAAILVLYWVGGMPPLNFWGWTLSSGPIANVLAAFYLVWMLNLYNFMDGIDGLAGVEAITVCLGAVIVYVFSHHSTLSCMPLLLSAAVGGFLYWNAPPARIFMGDAGSGFLGFILGVLSIQAAHIKPAYWACWLILLAVFIVDATVTLVRRLLQGEKVYQAHCSHAYQHAARDIGSHLPVTLGVCVINLIWLCPLAIFVGCGRIESLTGIFIAYLPLVIVAVQLKAGIIKSK